MFGRADSASSLLKVIINQSSNYWLDTAGSICWPVLEMTRVDWPWHLQNTRIPPVDKGLRIKWELVTNLFGKHTRIVRRAGHGEVKKKIRNKQREINTSRKDKIRSLGIYSRMYVKKIYSLTWHLVSAP